MEDEGGGTERVSTTQREIRYVQVSRENSVSSVCDPRATQAMQGRVIAKHQKQVKRDENLEKI